MNICMFTGNLTRDPEMRYSPNGKPITNFSIAVNERRGENEETEYIDFVCWEKLAETVAEHLRKGRRVAVTCSYHLERWEDNDGNKHQRPRFKARNVEFLDAPPRNEQEPARQAAPTKTSEEEELDDLPF